VARPQSETEYKPLITSFDGTAVPDWTAMPLVSGPYLSTPGHDGYLEIWSPETGTRTRLDYRD
jgi:hypothetical protein